MKNFLTQLLIGVVTSATISGQTDACTTMGLRSEHQSLVAKSYDWHLEEAYVFSNKKGVRKQALIFDPSAEPVRWTSQYNSITFNQYGRELPNSGMNEKGLVVEVMVLASSQYPSPANTPLTNESQIVQQLLDTAANVDEAIATISSVRIAAIMVPLHYLICDLKSCAAVEYVDGNRRIYRDNELPLAALANDTYETSLRYLNNFLGFGGMNAVPAKAGDSLKRFVVAAAEAKAFGNATNKVGSESIFNKLSRVEVGSTQWAVVYDQRERIISFRTRSHPQLRSIDAGLLMGGDCRSEEVKQLPMMSDATGDLSRDFTPYDAPENARIIRSHLASAVPQQIIDGAIAYPDTTECVH